MDIFEAARLNHVAELNTRLQTIHPDVTDSRGSTPLIIAAYYDNQEAVVALLKVNANANVRDGMGNTALMGACFKGYLDTARILLEGGAEVDAPNGNMATALTFATTFGHSELIKLLLLHGANVLVKDRFGKNPIDYAMIQENEECYALLVAAIPLSNSN